MNQIKAGAILSYFSLTINIVIGLVYTPWMINSIGQSDYGLYSLAISVINIFVFDFGLGTAIQRFTSKYVAEGNFQKANWFISVTMRIYIVISALIVIVLTAVYIYLPEIYKGLTPVELYKFRIIFAVASIFSIISFPLLPADGILLGCEKFVPLKVCDFIHKLVLVITMTICLSLGYGLYSLVIVSASSAFLTLVLKIICVYKYTFIRISLQFFDKQLFKSIIGFTLWILIIALCQRCVLSIAPSILGIYHNADIIAIFTIALSVEGYYFLFANAINGLFLPKVSKLIFYNQENEIIKLMIKVGIIQLYVTGLLFLGLLCFGNHFVYDWLGPNYNKVYHCFIILILPSFISLPQNIASTTMVAKNKVRYQAYASIAKGMTNLIIAFPMCKYYGALGMCIAISFAYMINVIILNAMYNKILHLDILLFIKHTYLKFLVPFVLFGVIGYCMNNIIVELTWINLIIKILIFSILYILSIPLLIGKTNRKYILATVKNIFGK